MANASAEGYWVPSSEVFPNPTRDIVQVRFTLQEPEKTEISISDVLGQTVKYVEDKYLSIDECTYSIDLKDIASGLYLLHIKSGKKFSNFKILVTH